jgi:hypothetical protein
MISIKKLGLKKKKQTNIKQYIYKIIKDLGSSEVYFW